MSGGLPEPYKASSNTATLIGYASVSTQDQTPARGALAKVGCRQILTDRASGIRAWRPELESAPSHLSHLRLGDAFDPWSQLLVSFFLDPTPFGERFWVAYPLFFYPKSNIWGSYKGYFPTAFIYNVNRFTTI